MKWLDQAVLIDESPWRSCWAEHTGIERLTERCSIMSMGGFCARLGVLMAGRRSGFLQV